MSVVNPKYNPMLESPGPLSVGNVVSAALRLYRDRFQSYFGIAFRACLWSIIPTGVDLIITYLLNNDPLLKLLSFVLSLYCSAKYFANVALIARLIFAELINKPEPVKSAQALICSKPFRFFMLQVYISLMIFALVIGLILVGVFFNIVMFSLFRDTGLFVLLIVAEVILFLVALIWLTSRFFIAELPLAVEEDSSVSTSIRRSWLLSQGYVWKIIIIVSVAFLVTLPIYILASIPLIIGGLTSAINFDADNLATFGLSFGLSVLLFVLLNVMAIPFWQGIKSVVYYDLRSRREGLGLGLADSQGDSW